MLAKVNQQQRHGRRGDAGDASRLSQGFGAMFGQFGAHFIGESGHHGVVEVLGNAALFVAGAARHFGALAVDVSGVLDIDFDLLGDGGRRGRGHAVLHQRGVGHLGSAQQFQGGDLVLAVADAVGQQGVAGGGNVGEFGAERGPPQVIDQAQFATHGRQAPVGIVFAQQQPMLGARGEHAVGLGGAARGQVVDQYADVGLVAAGDPRGLALHLARGIDAGQQPLRGRFFVAGGAVDLAGEEQAFDCGGFQ